MAEDKEQQGASGAKATKAEAKAAPERKYGARNDAYDDDDAWGVPPTQVTPEHAQRLNAEQQAFSDQLWSTTRLLQWLVGVVMVGAFIGYCYGANTIPDGLVGGNPWPSWGAWGAALWHGLGTGAGALSLLVPQLAYTAIARRHHDVSAAYTVYDLLRAEIVKYGLMIIILGCLFKFTPLPAFMVLLGMVLMILAHLFGSFLLVLRAKAELKARQQRTAATRGK